MSTHLTRIDSNWWYSEELCETLRKHRAMRSGQRTHALSSLHSVHCNTTSFSSQFRCRIRFLIVNTLLSTWIAETPPSCRSRWRYNYMCHKWQFQQTGWVRLPIKHRQMTCFLRCVCGGCGNFWRQSWWDIAVLFHSHGLLLFYHKYVPSQYKTLSIKYSPLCSTVHTTWGHVDCHSISQGRRLSEIPW